MTADLSAGGFRERPPVNKWLVAISVTFGTLMGTVDASIVLPVGALGLFMVSRFVIEPENIRRKNREIAEQQRNNLDWIGIALLCVGLCSLQYMLEEGQSENWFESRVIAACLLVSLFALPAFTIRELTAVAPAVDLRLFKDRVFLSGTFIGALMFAMLMSNMFLLPLFMQELLGFTAMQSGLALVPRVAVMMVATPIVGHIYNRAPVRVSWVGHPSVPLRAGLSAEATAYIEKHSRFACLLSSR